jgi:hypothetical protein
MSTQSLLAISLCEKYDKNMARIIYINQEWGMSIAFGGSRNTSLQLWQGIFRKNTLRQ